jgi:hypothetical protein
MPLGNLNEGGRGSPGKILSLCMARNPDSSPVLPDWSENLHKTAQTCPSISSAGSWSWFEIERAAFEVCDSGLGEGMESVQI